MLFYSGCFKLHIPNKQLNYHDGCVTLPPFIFVSYCFPICSNVTYIFPFNTFMLFMLLRHKELLVLKVQVFRWFLVGIGRAQKMRSPYSIKAASTLSSSSSIHHSIDPLQVRVGATPALAAKFRP